MSHSGTEQQQQNMIQLQGTSQMNYAYLAWEKTFTD